MLCVRKRSSHKEIFQKMRLLRCYLWMAIVEAEEIVSVGALDPEEVHLPGLSCSAW